jgi:purine-binding chemotaxis protein CheW
MLSGNRNPAGQALLVRVATHTCALNLAHVVEIMRPLPIEPVAGAPEMVSGLSAIRGVPVPVVALGGLFNAGGGAPSRFVVVRTGSKQVALAVDAVLGICDLAASVEQAMPPLLRDALSGAVDAIAALDSELYFVLNAARIVPDGRWPAPAVEER